MLQVKNILRSITPPIFLKFLYHSGVISHTVKWQGDFPSWEKALSQCSSYNSEIIFQKVASASRSVENGKSVFERDSALFDEIEYSWPLLSSLLWVYAKEQYLDLIDYGGALGTTWRQNKSFLAHLDNINWTIVEQKRFVEIGMKEFTIPPLNFKAALSEAYTDNTNTILLGSTLGYMEKPWELLGSIIDLNVKHIIIDRTAVQPTNRDRLTVQLIKPPIYKASYPCWILSEDYLLNKIENKYKRIEIWRKDKEMIPNSHFIGGVWVRK